jgi:DNA-directed RNA polymerase III subunit RPC1
VITHFERDARPRTDRALIAPAMSAALAPAAAAAAAAIAAAAPAPLMSTKETFQEPNVPKKMCARRRAVNSAAARRRRSPAAADAAAPSPKTYTPTHPPSHHRPRHHSDRIAFEVMPPAEIVSVAELRVHERALYRMPERRPQAAGVLDPRLGVSSKRATCETCGQALAECTGHFGYIALELPVFHIGYFRPTLQVLQCVCKACARVLLTPEERRQAARRLRGARGGERAAREAAFRRVLDRCKRVRACPHCGELNGVVKKAPASLKIVHDPWGAPPKGEAKPGAGWAAREAYVAELRGALAANPALGASMRNVVDDLNPLRVLGLFSAVPDADCELLDLAGRPEHLLLTRLPVPPVCIRPSVEVDGGAGSNEDDLTMKLMQIVEVNNILRAGLARGLPVPTLAENWDFLQVRGQGVI